MKLFLLGSLAFDELGHFEGRFKDLLHTEHLEKLSLSFVVQDSVEALGGCIGNMAYGLHLLKTRAHLCGLFGLDGVSYRAVLKDWGMEVSGIETVEGKTARAVITSDLEGAQIAHFNPGVSGKEAPAFELPEEAQSCDYFLVGPENPGRMLRAAALAKAKGLRVIADPGQLLHVFDAADLTSFVQGSEWLMINEYESELLKNKTGLSVEKWAQRLPGLVVTRGAEGCTLYSQGLRKDFPAVSAHLVDGTGAGDAFRAGFLAALLTGKDLDTCIETGTLLGAACVEKAFAQGYHLSESSLKRLKELRLLL